jgi:2-haloacid dehalogenase
MSDFDHIEALSFDCYGTLIDWETGIADTLAPWAKRRGVTVEPDDLVAAFARHESVVETEHPDWLYPSILAETMGRIGRDLGVEVNEIEGQAFGRSVGLWPAFADTAPALAQLASRFKLIILSNVDRVSFRQSNDRFGVEFDLVITAEDVGAYKPSAANFDALEQGLASLGIERQQLLHVAESLYHDHVPALGRQLSTAWIHRRHDKDGFGATATPADAVEPNWRFTSMAELAAALYRRGQQASPR